MDASIVERRSIRRAEPELRARGEMGRYFQYAPSLQLIDLGLYWHSDHETSDLIPAPGLAATTRAYAKIINDVNGVDLKDLQPVVQR